MKSDKGHLTENKDYGAPVSAISYFSSTFFFTSSTFLHDLNFPFLHDVNATNFFWSVIQQYLQMSTLILWAIGYGGDVNSQIIFVNTEVRE